MRATTALVVMLVIPWNARAQQPPASCAAAEPRSGPVAMPAGPRTAAALHAIFARLDGNRDGVLAPDEWARVARDPEDLPVDPDGDGRVTEAEFVESFLRIRTTSLIVLKQGATDLLTEGREAATAGRLETAVRAFEGAASAAPCSARPQLEVADCQIRLGRAADAMDVLSRAADRIPNSPEIAKALADCAERLGFAHAAGQQRARANSLSRFASRVVRRDLAPGAAPPEEGCAGTSLDEDARFVCEIRGKVACNEYAAALAAAQEAVRAGKGGWRQRLICAVLLDGSGRAAEALSCLETAARRGAPATTIEALRAGLLLDVGDRPRALESIGRMNNSTCPEEDLFELAWQLSARDEWTLAQPLLQRAMMGFYEIQIGSLLLAVDRWKAGQRFQARLFFDHPPEPLSLGRHAWKLLLNLAQDLGCTKQAIRMLSYQAYRQPEPVTWLLLADAQRAIGDRSGQLRSLEEARQHAPRGTPWRSPIDAALASLGVAPAAEARTGPGSTR
ncbi:MAG: tetratricopeptide repeat protein [Candidatus Wallbacteria bacterium]|nr:tetratricopeptide repeat protein [Candidatus Wallbacteria bacterium]